MQAEQTENALDLSAQRISLITFVILSMNPLVGMGVDLIAPSLPAISYGLHVSTTVSKNLVAVYLLGYALGSFILGFLCDAWGRRKFAVGGLLVFVLASLLPIIFPDAVLLLCARFLQGLAIAGAAIAARSVLSDMLDAHQLVRIAPLIATLWGIGPIVGPVIGGYLQSYFNWQACFYFFALVSFIELVAMYFLVPETHYNRQALNLKQIKINLVTIISHRVFMGAVTLMGIVYSLLIVFNTLGPFFIQTVLGKSPIYFGRVALCLGLVFLCGTTLCRHLIKSYTPEKIMLAAIGIFSCAAVIGLIAAYLDSKNIAVLIITSACMFLASGLVYPAGMGKALALFRHLAGSGSAITMLVNILMTSIAAFVMSFINAESAISIIWIYLGLMLLGGLTYWFLLRQKPE